MKPNFAIICPRLLETRHNALLCVGLLKLQHFWTTKNIALDFSPVIINFSRMALLDTNFGLRFLGFLFNENPSFLECEFIQVKSTFQISDFISINIFWLYNSSSTFTHCMWRNQFFFFLVFAVCWGRSLFHLVWLLFQLSAELGNPYLRSSTLTNLCMAL